MKLIILLALFCVSCSLFGQNKVSKFFDKSAAELSDSAIALWRKNQYDQALLLINNALTIARQNNDTLQIAKCLNNIGLIYSGKGNAVKSLYYYEQSLTLIRLLNNQEQLPTALLNIGIAYKEQAIYDKAITYLFEAVDYLKKSQNHKNLSAAYNTIGNILMLEKRYEKALEFHRQALKIRQEMSYDEGVAGSLNNIGIVYKRINQYDSAIFYFNASLKLKKLDSSPEQMANTISHIADIYIAKNQYIPAEQYYKKAYRIRDSIQNKKGIAHSLYDLGYLYYNHGSFKESENYLLQSIKKSKVINAADVLLRSYDILRSLYRKNGQHTKALLYDDLYITLYKQQLGEENQRLLAQMQVKYETEKKQNEIEQLNKEKETREAFLVAQQSKLKVRETREFYLTILIIALSLFSVIVFMQKTRISKQKELILEEKKKVSALMAEMHHRIKNNFQVLQSMFDLQLNYIKDALATEALKVNRNRITAMMLIHKDLYLDENVTKINVDSYLYAIVENLRSIYGLKERIEVKYNIEPNISLEADKATSLGLLLNELTTNAFKYAFEKVPQPLLTIQFKRQNSKYCFTVADNGPGLFESKNAESFGQKLIEIQVKQLKGELQKKIENGVEYNITF